MLEGIPEIDDLIDRLVGVPQWLADCQVPKPVLLPTVVVSIWRYQIVIMLLP